MNASTSTSITKRKNAPSFQDLNLFFQDIEILHQFKVYCTATTSFFFHLKKQQCDNIKQNNKSIFLRICKYTPDKIQKDYLPKVISISINGCYFNLNSKSKEPNWKTPLDITSKCRIVTTRNANNIELNLNNYKPFLAKGYGIEIVLAKKLTISEQLQLLKTDRFLRQTDETLKLIKENCSTFEDLECETIKVPLTCGITKKLIQIPVCGKHCKHIACFEAQTFLEIMLQQPEWVCTVCNNVIRKSDLVRDPFIENILNNTQRSIDIIEFDKLGNFKVSKQENKRQKQNSKEIECIVLDNDLGNSLDNNFTINSSINVDFSNNFTNTSINTNFNSLTPKLENLPFFSHHSHLMNTSDFFNSIGLNSFTKNSTTRKTRTNNNQIDEEETINLSDSSCIVLDSDTDDEIKNNNYSRIPSLNSAISDSQSTIINNDFRDLFNSETTNSFSRGRKRNFSTSSEENLNSESDSHSNSENNSHSNSENDSHSNSEGDSPSNSENDSHSNSENSNSTGDENTFDSDSYNLNSNLENSNSSMTSFSNVSDSRSDLSSLNSNKSITSNTSLSSGSTLNRNTRVYSFLQSRNSLRLRHKKMKRDY